MLGKVYRFLHKKILTEDAGEGEEENQYYLEVYDTVARTAQLKEVDMADLGLDGAFLRGAQVMGSESFALQMWNGENRLVYTDLTQVQAEVAIGEVYESHGIAEDIVPLSALLMRRVICMPGQEAPGSPFGIYISLMERGSFC